MNSLTDIPIALIPRDNTVDQITRPASLQALALLKELRNMLDRLISTGESNSIDIRSLPLFPGDYDNIKEVLGDGEVTATVSAMGPTHIRETAIPGIWWVTHCNALEEVVAEFIEVTSMPQLLYSQEAELQHAGQWLEQRINSLSQPSRGEPDN